MERVTIAADVFALDLKVDDALPFRAGQFISLRVGLDEDDNPIQRSYSVASSPASATLRLIVKRVPGGFGSDFLDALKLGDALTFAGPMGFFVLELAHRGDLVFGATGVGIAPVLPMLDEALARAESGGAFAHWGIARAPDHLFWLDELKARQANPRFSYRLFISGAELPDGATAGRITQPIVDALDELVTPSLPSRPGRTRGR